MDVSRMLTIIGNYGFSDTDSTTLVDMLNETYHDVCGLEPWPFLERDLALTMDGVTGLPTNWPSDFRSVITLDDESAGNRLEPMRIEEHRERHIANLSLQGNSLYYYFIADQLYVYPIPSAETSQNQLQLVYLALEPDLTTGTLSADVYLPSRYHWVLIYGVLSMLYLDENDQAQSDYFQARMDRKVERMRRDLWQRNFDKPDTIDTGYEDWDYYEGAPGGELGAFGP